MLSTIDRESDPRQFGSTPAEEAIIARILALRASGLGQLRIARQLDAEGLRSRSGQPWSAPVIGTILRRNGACSTFLGAPQAASTAEVSAPKDESVIALAKTGCEACNGLGRQAGGEVCSCVGKHCFDVVMAKFRYASAGHHLTPPIRIDHFVSGGGKSVGSRLANEEFCADVFLTAKRALNEEDFRLFRFRHLLAADVNLCARQLGTTREACIQRLQYIEARLGETWRTIKPYHLYPPNEYLRARIPGGARPCVPVSAARTKENGPVLRPPLAPRAQRREAA
jgi:hypothetical protein